MFTFKIILFTLAVLVNAISMGWSVKHELDARNGLKTPRVGHLHVARGYAMACLLFGAILGHTIQAAG